MLWGGVSGRNIESRYFVPSFRVTPQRAFENVTTLPGVMLLFHSTKPRRFCVWRHDWGSILEMDQSSHGDNQPFGSCSFMQWNPSKFSTIATTVISAISSTLAILLNLLVIIAVAKKKQLRSIYNILLASMAIADLLIAGVAQPLFLIIAIFRLRNDQETVCLFVIAGFFAMYVQSASIYHLTEIAWERYVAVKNSANNKLIVTRNRARICIIVSLASLTALSVVPSAVYIAGQISQTAWAIVSVGVYLLPLISIAATVYFYVTIYLRTRKVRNSMNAAQLARINFEKEVAKTAFALTVALLVSFLPTFIFIFLHYLSDFFDRDATLWSVTLNQLNSCLSPILYFYRNHRFRNAVLQMFNIQKPSEIQISSKGNVENSVKRRVKHDEPHVKHNDPHENAGNAKQRRRTLVRSNSWGPATFAEMQEALRAPRRKTVPMCPRNGATPHKEVTSNYGSDRCLWTHRDCPPNETITVAELLGKQLCPIERMPVEKEGTRTLWNTQAFEALAKKTMIRTNLSLAFQRRIRDHRNCKGSYTGKSLKEIQAF